MTERIRPAEARDAEAFCRLNFLFNHETGALDASGSSTETVLVAESRSGLAGFCCIQVLRSACSASPWAEFTELFVAAPHRRRGVGTALIAGAERVAPDAGCRELVLQTRAENAESP